MDILQTDQLVTVGVFLAVLIAALYWVQGNRAALTGRIAKGRRMSVAEVTALGADARAMLLNIDGRDYLVVSAKKQAPVITALPPAPAQELSQPNVGPAPEIAQVRA
ncbi:MAG: flagellar biosynthetic protein FliO [Thalassovita sp.]